MNETEYLLSSDKNPERLLESINRIKQKVGNNMNTVFNVNEVDTLLEKVFMKAAEDYRESGGNMRDVLKGDMKTKVQEFNVNAVNTRQISRKWLLETLNKEEQKMFKAFVKSVTG